MSCGAIILYCLNLPIEIRFLLENVFILGMIPGPNLPDAWAIAHVLDSFVKMMNEFDSPGKLVPTHQHPGGTLVASRVLPLLADLGAIRKVAGYLSHNAIQFCSFCLIKQDEIESLDYESWTLRDAATVKMQANVWRAKTTITAKAEWSKETGVKWTPMHNLAHWDPVKHVVLGFMHNSLEGIVEHHLRVYWGIGRTMHVAQDLAADDKEERFTESDASEAADELAGLEEESRSAGDSMDVDDESTPKRTSVTPAPENPGDLDMGHNDDDDDDEEFFPPDFDFGGPGGAFCISDGQLEIIRDCIKNVQLPTWVGRPPMNLGEASHGKLKAQQLLILFTVIFPLIIPELWWDKGEVPKRLLDNFYHLVACTNIISSYSTSNTEADRYMDHYIQYRKSMRQLFHHFNTALPNHHLAMHNRDLLKFWGPLATISEFPGERLNGEFGKVKTNRRICKSTSVNLCYKC